MDRRRGLVASIPRIALPVFWAETEKILVKCCHLFLAVFIVVNCWTTPESAKRMNDALWLAYIATFIKRSGATSATGFMGAVTGSYRVAGKIWQTQCAIIKTDLGLFAAVEATIGAIRCGWRCMDS